MAVNYSWNAGLTLDTDLALLLLRRGAHRLASVLEREATQAHVCVGTRSYTGSRLNVKTRP